MSDKQINLLVLFGGVSGEHEVSLVSAENVISAVDKERYHLLPVLISKEGRWFCSPEPLPLLKGDNSSAFAVSLPADPTEKRLISLENKQLPPSISVPIDCAFPVLHGPNGEDGTIQGLFTLAGIPFVGAGVLPSALLMDKGYMKMAFKEAGLPIPPYIVFNYNQWQKEQSQMIKRIESELTYPIFTKPCNLGSSVGICKVSDRVSLIAGLEEAFAYDNRVIVEQGISAREIECSVLGNEHPQASIMGEIIPANEFYDYQAKYVSQDSQLIVPAPIGEELMKLGQEMAVKAFICTECRGMGRVDFLLDKETGKFWLSEINTIPGFTPISMYPKLWIESGLSYPRLIDKLVELAMEKYKAQSRLRRSYEVEK